jgi:hypothetical protein
MDSYSVIPDNSTVPELTDLQLLYLDQPTGGGCGYVAFSFTPNISMLSLYEQAVGQRCRVLRTRAGQTQACGGAVKSVTPTLRVSLDGASWE